MQTRVRLLLRTVRYLKVIVPAVGAALFDGAEYLLNGSGDDAAVVVGAAQHCMCLPCARLAIG